MTLPNGLDTKDLKFLGKGAQGEVYQIDKSRCVKIFTRSKGLPRELNNLQKAEHEPRFPKVFEWGDNYIIREYIKGIELRSYLRKNPLTESISFQLVDLLQAFERIHFTRIDTQLKNIIITSKGELRPIDFVNSMRVNQPYPMLLLGQLKKLDMKKTFLKHVKKINKDLYHKWKTADQK